MTQATLRPALAALTFVAALWCAPDAGASGIRAADPRGVARPTPAVGDIVTTPLCEGFHLCNSLDASEVAPGRPLWLSRDPLGEAGGLNLYGFLNNDPVNQVDYLGMAAIFVDSPQSAGSDPQAAAAFRLALQMGAAREGVQSILNKWYPSLRTRKRPENPTLGQHLLKSTYLRHDVEVPQARAEIAAYLQSQGFAFGSGLTNTPGDWMMHWAEGNLQATVGQAIANQLDPQGAAAQFNEVAVATSELPVHAAVEALNTASGARIHSGAAFAFNGWDSGFSLVPVSPGERVFEGALAMMPLATRSPSIVSSPTTASGF